jgi:pyridoxal phosphate enzyme (YggS family)
MKAPSAADVAANVVAVRSRIADAARRAGREPSEITLVAAAKTVSTELVTVAIDAGVADIGENRAQELLVKAPALADHPTPPRWHFIGSLQRNKVKSLAPWITLWQSVDREALGAEIARVSPGAHVLVEVNLDAEPTKAGCAPNDAGRLVDALVGAGLVVDGLMAVPPVGDEPRVWFAALAEIATGLGVRELSMGMTHDFEAAIEEGATIVRIGRALFGARPT